MERGARHFGETELASLIATIATIAAINVWNRMNVAVRQLVGEWAP